MCGLHTLFFLVSLIERPYVTTFENVLNSTCILLNAINAGISIMVSYGFVFPSYAFLVLGIGNIAFPIGILLYQILVDMRRQKDLVKQLREHETAEEKMVRFFLINALAGCRNR